MTQSQDDELLPGVLLKCRGQNDTGSGFGFKMMNFVSKHDGFCITNDELRINNDEFCG